MNVLTCDRFEELDVKVRDYRRRIREMGDVAVTDGLTQSPRDSPVATATTTATSTHHAAITESTVAVTARYVEKFPFPSDIFLWLLQSCEV